MLETKSLQVSLGGNRILKEINLAVKPGELTVVIGPNGAGKSTLLRAMAGLIRPTGGEVIVGNQPLSNLSASSLARQLAFCQPRLTIGMSMTVHDLVTIGRYPRWGWWGRPAKEDRETVQNCMEATGISHLGNRLFETLSSGEQQRTLLAMALAQETTILVLDEPEAHLDPPGQGAVFSLLAALASEGRTVLTAGHQVNAAAPFAGRIIILSRGRIIASGHPSEVLTPGILRSAYGPGLRILTDPETDIPFLVPESSPPTFSPFKETS